MRDEGGGDGCCDGDVSFGDALTSHTVHQTPTSDSCWPGPLES